jgi:hypothetical protein
MQAFLGYTMFAFLFDWTDTNWLARRKGKMFRFTPSPVSCVPACGSFDRFALLTTFSPTLRAARPASSGGLARVALRRASVSLTSASIAGSTTGSRRSRSTTSVPFWYFYLLGQLDGCLLMLILT